MLSVRTAETLSLSPHQHSRALSQRREGRREGERKEGRTNKKSRRVEGGKNREGGEGGIEGEGDEGNEVQNYNQRCHPACVLLSGPGKPSYLQNLAAQHSFWSQCSYFRKNSKPSLGEKINMRDISNSSLVKRRSFRLRKIRIECLISTLSRPCLTALPDSSPLFFVAKSSYSPVKWIFSWDICKSLIKTSLLLVISKMSTPQFCVSKTFLSYPISQKCPSCCSFSIKYLFSQRAEKFHVGEHWMLFWKTF